MLLASAVAKRAANIQVRAHLIKRIKAGSTEVTAVYLFGDFQKPPLVYFDAMGKLVNFEESLMNDDGAQATGSATVKKPMISAKPAAVPRLTTAPLIAASAKKSPQIPRTTGKLFKLKRSRVAGNYKNLE